MGVPYQNKLGCSGPDAPHQYTAEIDPPTVIEDDAFRLQSHSLLRRAVTFQRDFALRIDHALPRHIVRTHGHCITHDARVTALPHERGDIAIRDDLAARHLADNIINVGEQCARFLINWHGNIILAPPTRRKRTY